MKPEPKPTAVVCSLCGLPWERHTKVTELRGKKIKEPTAELCIELLKADLAARPRWQPQIIGSSGYGNYTLQ